MKMRTIIRSFGALYLGLGLAGCGKGALMVAGTDASSTTGGGGGNPSIQVEYRDEIHNAWIPLNSGVSFPSTVGLSDAGYLDLVSTFPCPVGSFLQYTFRITNTGGGSLSGSGSAASIVKTSDPSASPATDPGAYGDYIFSIGTQPSFPLSSGSSTTFTVRFDNHASATICYLGYFSPIVPFQSGQSAHLTIATNDPTHPNYELDLNLFGWS